MTVKIKRVYEPYKSSDGLRILVDRLWPRGLSKKKAHVDLWIKTIAPTTELRKWFNHDPVRWKKFKQLYAKELNEHKDIIQLLKYLINEEKRITLLYAAHDEQYNNAIALYSIAL